MRRFSFRVKVMLIREGIGILDWVSIGVASVGLGSDWVYIGMLSCIGGDRVKRI